MNRQQQLRLAARLEAYAPCIHAVHWLAGSIDTIEYDAERIEPRFLAGLKRLCDGQRILLRAI